MKKNVTNQMIAKSLIEKDRAWPADLQAGADLPNRLSISDIEWAYEELRDKIGNPQPLGSYRPRGAGRRSLSDDRCDKISSIINAILNPS